MLPPAIWEAINHLDATKKLLTQTSQSTVINGLKAYNYLMDSWKGENTPTFSADVMKRYKSMGRFLNILLLANQGELEKKSKSNLSNTISLLNGRIKIMDDFVDDVEQISIHNETYDNALYRLNRRRPDENYSKNNAVDAANVAITYDLTTKSEDINFRLISHSRQPSLAFKNIAVKEQYHHDVLLACCPQLVATIILAETNQLKGFNHSDFKNSTYFTQNIRVLEGIKKQYNDLKYGQQFLTGWTMEERASLMEKTVVDQTTDIQNALTSLYNHIMDLSEFRNQTYPSFIEPILDINSGKDGASKDGENFVGAFEDYTEDLIEMCKNGQRYKTLIENAVGIIDDELKETYKGLGKYVDGKYKQLLTPNMRSLLDELTKEM